MDFQLKPKVPTWRMYQQITAEEGIPPKSCNRVCHRQSPRDSYRQVDLNFSAHLTGYGMGWEDRQDSLRKLYFQT